MTSVGGGSPRAPAASTAGGGGGTAGGSPTAGARTAAPTLGTISWVSSIDVGDLARLSRMHSFHTAARYTKLLRPPPLKRRPPLAAAVEWWAGWAVPGLGMFSEAYIIFSLGLIKPLQEAAFPRCFVTHQDCSPAETHAMNYLQIGGIIAGMLAFGTLGDVLGRRWGSRIVASLMVVGAALLTFTSLAPGGRGYLGFFLFAQTLHGLGVGGEYPMAAASAAERSQSDPRLRHKRGQHVLLTFSQQGAGHFVNACVIVALLALFGQTGQALDPAASRAIISLQFAVAAAVCAFTVGWRFTRLEESAVWAAEREDAVDINKNVEGRKTHHLYRSALYRFGPRLTATSLAWTADNYALYGNRLFQSKFMAALYPKSTPFERMQWAVLNGMVALMGYWAAAAAVDKRWYGRRTMQTVGFLAMFGLYLACAAGYGALTADVAGYRAYQALYFLSSFFTQFGPNSTTFLLAAEVFPTDTRSTFQGISAAWGKLGAIAADATFGFVSTRTTFWLLAAVSLFGAAITLALLPDTTGLSLDELDRLHKYMITDHFPYYHGEAVNPRHLSLFERFVLRWSRQYDPALDAAHKELQILGASEHTKLYAASTAAPSAAPSLAGFSLAGGDRGGPGLSPSPWQSGALTWTESGGWGLNGSSLGALEPLGRAVAGPSWAGSIRSTGLPASRRLPATGEAAEGEEGGSSSAAAGGLMRAVKQRLKGQRKGAPEGDEEEGADGGGGEAGGGGQMEDVD